MNICAWLLSNVTMEKRSCTNDKEGTGGGATVARDSEQFGVAVSLANDLVLDSQEGVDVV